MSTMLRLSGVWIVEVHRKSTGYTQRASQLVRRRHRGCPGRWTHRVHEQHGHVVSTAAHPRGTGEYGTKVNDHVVQQMDTHESNARVCEAKRG